MTNCLGVYPASIRLKSSCPLLLDENARAGAGVCVPRRGVTVDAGDDREESHISLHVAQFAGHARYTVGPEFLGLLHDARVRLLPAIADDLGDLDDLTAH